jgi:glucose-6-phosphate isomerase
VGLADEVDLKGAIKSLFDGEIVNASEGRPALHTALRRPVGDKLSVNGVNVMPEVHKVLNQITDLVGRIHDGLWRGYSEKPITDVVNIGIGGSFLGPELVSEALLAYAQKGVRCHYLANIDGSEFHELAMKLRAETTLFIVSSKSFNTLETLKNAQAARAWYLAQGGSEAELHRHFIAVSSNNAAAVAFGIREENIFPMWDWVGGRYSLWSAIGLPIALAIGMSNFKELLSGAYTMDQHFLNTPFEQNMPVLLALLGVWYGNFWGAQSHAILPYDHYLRNITKHLQQLDMEERAPGRYARQHRHRPGDLGWRGLQRPARLPPVAAPGHPTDPGRFHRADRQLQPGGRPSPVAVRQLPVAKPGTDARQDLGRSAGRAA